MFSRSRSQKAGGSAKRVAGLLALAAGVFLIATLSATSAIAVDDDWDIEGGGWGHGVGLSQYGAYGMALDGFDAAEILGHYYSGAFPVAASASLGPEHWIFDDEALWIGLEQDVASVDREVLAEHGDRNSGASLHQIHC